MLHHFINIDKLVYYSNNVALFTIDCSYIGNNRYFFIICTINYAVNEETSGRSLCEHDFARRRQTFILSMLRDLHENARIRPRLLRAEVAVSREQDEKSNAPLSSSRASGFLPPVSDKRRSRPGKPFSP